MKTALDGLVWSVRALAQPADFQQRLFPSFVVLADELALTFEEYYPPALAQCRDHWSAKQIDALSVLDQKLTAMSGPNNEELWLADDCLHHPEWAVVRELAKSGLIAFDWPADQPAPNDAVYVAHR